MPTPAKRVLGYHGMCDDGFGAAFAAWKEFGDDARYLPLTYGQYDVETFGDVGNAIVYVADFAIPLEMARELVRRGALGVTILDHHKSAMEDWAKAVGPDASVTPRQLVFAPQDEPISAFFDMDRSGAQLAWEFFTSNPQLELIRYIGDNDLWKHELPGSREFTRALRSYKMDFQAWEKIASEPVEQMLELGKGLARAHEVALSMVLSLSPAQPLMLADPRTKHTGALLATGLCVNSNKMYASDLGHMLALESGTFGAVWYAINAEVVEVSLRSDGEFDVSEIARFYDGGGHRNAAGFRMPLLRWVAMLKFGSTMQVNKETPNA